MANTIQIKRGSSAPTSAQLASYELGYNISDNTLYINNGGTIIPLATNLKNFDLKGFNLILGTASSSSNDSSDILWQYGNGQEKARIWTANDYTAKTAPNFREYSSDGTLLHNGYLVLDDGTGASGTWGISISGNAATASALTMSSNDPTSSTTMYPTFVAGNGNVSQYRNDGLKYLTLQGTTSALGYGGLRLGNTTNSGTAGNKWGFLDIYPERGAYYARIRASATLTDSRTFILPDAGGTIALDGHTHSYLPLSGGTVTGTLVLSKTQDASGTADNSPALIIGGASTGQHIEIDGNEILAKSNATTPSVLWLQDNSGTVKVGGTGGLIIEPSGGAGTPQGFMCRNISYGSAAPSSGDGNNGDIFLLYS